MPPGYRRCVSCRQVQHRQDLWRVVRVFHSGQVQLDDGQGRSAYLCPQLTCLQMAKKHKRLERSLKTRVPDEIFQTLSDRLNRDSSLL